MPAITNPNYKLKVVGISDGTTVAHAPSSITNTLQPPKGFVYEVVEIYMNIPIPAGGSSGTHRITVRNQNMHVDARTFYLDSVFGTGIDIQTCTFASTSEVPSGATSQESAIRTLHASYDNPLDFVYKNSTDADQVGTRIINILVRKYREAS